MNHESAGYALQAPQEALKQHFEANDLKVFYKKVASKCTILDTQYDLLRSGAQKVWFFSPRYLHVYHYGMEVTSDSVVTKLFFNQQMSPKK